jgi:hypothetical protein
MASLYSCLGPGSSVAWLHPVQFHCCDLIRRLSRISFRALGHPPTCRPHVILGLQTSRPENGRREIACPIDASREGPLRGWRVSTTPNSARASGFANGWSVSTCFVGSPPHRILDVWASSPKKITSPLAQSESELLPLLALHPLASQGRDGFLCPTCLP